MSDGGTEGYGRGPTRTVNSDDIKRQVLKTLRFYPDGNRLWSQPHPQARQSLASHTHPLSSRSPHREDHRYPLPPLWAWF